MSALSRRGFLLGLFGVAAARSLPARAASNAVAIPTREPGVVMIGGRRWQQVEWREEDFYDTVECSSFILHGFIKRPLGQ